MHMLGSRSFLLFCSLSYILLITAILFVFIFFMCTYIVIVNLLVTFIHNVYKSLRVKSNAENDRERVPNWNWEF